MRSTNNNKIDDIHPIYSTTTSRGHTVYHNRVPRAQISYDPYGMTVIDHY